MKTLSLILSIVLFGVALTSQTRLEVDGEAKITILRNSTTSDENIVRKADGNLAIRKYRVGHFAHGGIVFWVDESGEHGLVCTKSDVDTTRWYAGTIGDTQAKGNGPYSGEMNTAIIISSQVAIGDDGNSYAARVCSELQITEGGFTYGDWYLPSQEELLLMYDNKAKIDATAIAKGGTAFSEILNYWSSTEEDENEAYRVRIANGVSVGELKFNSYAIRAVRAF